MSAPLPATMMLGPIATMSDYAPVHHPKIADLRRRAQLVIRGLVRISEYGEAEETDDRRWTRCGDDDQLRASDEAWRVSLRHMVQTQTELETGLATHRFMREVRQHARDMAPALERAREAAIDALKHHRTFAAIMADEDDTDFGIETFPPAREDGAIKGPSLSFEW